MLGVVGGTIGLFEQSTVEITDDLLDAYRNQGGFDLLGRSVDSIRTETEMAKAKEACVALDLDGLVVSTLYFFLCSVVKIGMDRICLSLGMDRICLSLDRRLVGVSVPFVKVTSTSIYIQYM